MLQTKGIETTARELDFPCFLQNKYLFATKAAGRMRHVPLTLKACVFVPDAVEVWSSSECYLRSGLSFVSPSLWINVFSYLYKTERGRRPRESSRNLQQVKSKVSREVASWCCSLHFSFQATASFPPKPLWSSLMYWLSFRMSSKGTASVQKYVYRCPSPTDSSIWLFGEEISSSRGWLAKRRGNRDELFGVQGLCPLLDADFESIHTSLSRAPSLNKPSTTDLCFV